MTSGTRYLLLAIGMGLLIGGFFLIVALVFIYRSFYSMRIPEEDINADVPTPAAPPEKKRLSP